MPLQASCSFANQTSIQFTSFIDLTLPGLLIAPLVKILLGRFLKFIVAQPAGFGGRECLDGDGGVGGDEEVVECFAHDGCGVVEGVSIAFKYQHL